MLISEREAPQDLVYAKGAFTKETNGQQSM